MNHPEQAGPASMVNLAFDTGAIAERTAILKLIRAEMEKQIVGMAQFSEAARHKYNTLEKLADEIMDRAKPKAEQSAEHAD